MYMLSNQTLVIIAAIIVAQCVFFGMWHGAPTTKWRLTGFVATISSWGFLAYMLLTVPYAETQKARNIASKAAIAIHPEKA